MNDSPVRTLKDAPQPTLLASTPKQREVHGILPPMLIAYHYGYSAVARQLRVKDVTARGRGSSVAFVGEKRSEAHEKLHRAVVKVYGALKIKQAMDEKKYKDLWDEVVEAEDDKSVEGKLQTAVEALVASVPGLREADGKLRQSEDISSIDALVEAADKAGPVLHAFGDKLAKDCSGEYKAAETKGEDRIMEKLKKDYDNDIRCIVDAARGSLVLRTLGELLAAVEELNRLASEGNIKIVRIKDRLTASGKPANGGYRDIMLNLLLESGHICELQLQLRKLHSFKAEAHVIYSILREMGWDGSERPPAVNDAWDEQQRALRKQASKGDIIHSGLLDKKANHMKVWRERYFEIRVNDRHIAELFYYLKSSDEAPKAQPKGKISLDGAIIDDNKNQRDLRHGERDRRLEFIVTERNTQHRYKLRARTPQEKEDWMEKLQEYARRSD